MLNKLNTLSDINMLYNTLIFMTDYMQMKIL